VLEHTFELLELPVQYGDALQQLDALLQELPVQVVVDEQMPLAVLQVVPSGQMPEYVPQCG